MGWQNSIDGVNMGNVNPVFGLKLAQYNPNTGLLSSVFNPMMVLVTFPKLGNNKTHKFPPLFPVWDQQKLSCERAAWYPHYKTDKEQGQNSFESLGQQKNWLSLISQITEIFGKPLLT